jgi:hypothetical protein
MCTDLRSDVVSPGKCPLGMKIGFPAADAPVCSDRCYKNGRSVKGSAIFVNIKSVFLDIWFQWREEHGK